MYRRISLLSLIVSVMVFAGIGAAETPNHVTILYDSFGKNPALTMDWGYAALIEFEGKRAAMRVTNSHATVMRRAPRHEARIRLLKNKRH